MSVRTAHDAPARLLAACHAISHASGREITWATAEQELSRFTTASVSCLVMTGNQTLVPIMSNQAMPGSLPLALSLAWGARDSAGILTMDESQICAAPCLVHGRLAGAIVLVSTTGRPIDETDRMLLAAVAMTTGQSLAAHELRAETRASLARSLHDGPVQDLATALMVLEHLLQTGAIAGSASASLAMETLHQAAAELRHFIASLQGVELNAEAIDSPSPASALFPDASQEEALLAVTREALRNIRKHADAQSIQIALQRTISEIAVMIQDDGIGFIVEEKPGHFGLAQMRDNAARAGAALQVASTRRDGTRVLLQAREHGAPAANAGMLRKDPADE